MKFFCEANTGDGYTYPDDQLYVRGNYVENGTPIGEYGVWTIPWPMWKDAKWARSAHSTGDPLHPQMGWFFPRIAWRRLTGEPRTWHVSWKPVKTWRVRLR